MMSAALAKKDNTHKKALERPKAEYPKKRTKYYQVYVIKLAFWIGVMQFHAFLFRFLPITY